MKTKQYLLALGFLITIFSHTFLHAQTRNQPTPAPLPDDSLAFCRKQNWAKTCLNTLLTYRCGQYYDFFSPLKTQLCSASAYSMIDYLDYKTVQVIENNKVYRFKVIFTNQLKTLINDSVVQQYLSLLANDLSQALKSHKPFDLYKYTLKYAKDRDTAILWLGILFQDTTFSRVQVQYLEDLDNNGKLSIQERQIKELMKEIAVMLEPKNLVKEDYQKWLKLYPDLKDNDLNSYLNPSFYHFYPIALMASYLRQNSWTKSYAFLLPFALNSDYEFQTLDSENWPWRHPAPFKITPNLEWKMRDIYTGLVASLFGANKEALTPAFSTFKTEFATNPYRTMKEWAHKTKRTISF
jgi:hypothetical protein